MRARSTAATHPHGSNFAGVHHAIVYVPPGRIRVSRRKLRRHPQSQVRELAAGISRTGFNVPILVDENLGLISGHARLAAAELLGLTQVPVIRITHLTDEQLRLFAIFDNRIAEGGSWNEGELSLELDDLRILEPTLDLTDSGFAIGEIDALVGLNRTAELSDFDLPDPPVAPGPPISREGDLWVCGRHRLLCGDSTDPEVIARLVDGAIVRQHLSDPPYDLPARAISSTGRFGNFVRGAGELGPERFTDFLHAYLTAAQPVLADGAIVYAFMDHRHIAQLLAAAEQAGFAYLNLLVWVKGQAGQGTFYRSGHELVGVFRHGDAPIRNTIQLGTHGRNRSNVLSYPGVRGKGGGGAKALAMHPTVKNVALIADLILDATAPGDAVLDSFGGSGTTMIAAEKIGRTAYLCELDPRFVDVAVERFAALGSGEPVLAETGQTFSEVRSQRLAQPGETD